MELVVKNGSVFTDGEFKPQDIRISGEVIAEIEEDISPADGVRVVDAENRIIIPGLADVHVHFREPGFSYKETIRTGSMAAAHGGYTAVCAMPNLSPVPDCTENLLAEQKIIDRDAVIRVFPYGAVTRGQKGETLADLEKMADHVAAFSDDGFGVQSGDIMRQAMEKAAALGKVIAAHCEDESYITKGWSVNDCVFAIDHGLIGNNPESEWRQVERDIGLARETGCAYHVCHVSTRESVGLIRKAKAEGLNISCETAPHYIFLSDAMLEDDGRFRMNPPIRSEEDRMAIVEGICDGTIDMIATDHAPHSAEEKGRGIAGSLNGISGLEAAFPVLYTGLVKMGLITFEKLMDLMCFAPKRRFSLPGAGGLAVGGPADIAVFDLNRSFRIDPEEFLSMGKSTPFEGRTVCGKCCMTVCRGEICWDCGD